MPVIGTSGSTSGDGKRRVAAWPKRPRPSSTLPLQARFGSVSEPDLAARLAGSLGVQADLYFWSLGGGGHI